MTTRKDVMMMEATIAFAQGLGGAQVDPAALEEFHKRYYDWIDTPKKNPRANGRSPQDVWEKEREEFAARFREIGQKAAATGSPVGAQSLIDSATTVEKAYDCPWCSIQP